jgi:hypothetical protein
MPDDLFRRLSLEQRRELAAFFERLLAQSATLDDHGSRWVRLRNWRRSVEVDWEAALGSAETTRLLQIFIEDAKALQYFAGQQPYEARVARACRLFSFFLSRKTRAEVFEPAYEDLFADYWEARGLRGKWTRRILLMAFIVRAALLIWSSLWASGGQSLRALFTKLPRVW